MPPPSARWTAGQPRANAGRTGSRQECCASLCPLPQNHPVDFLAVEVDPILSVKAQPGFLYRAIHQPRVLGPLVAVDPGRHIPGLLPGQRAALAQGHVGLNKGRCGVDAVHASAPVVGLGAPQRREDIIAGHAMALAVLAVAEGALLRIDLCATGEVVATLGLLAPR